MMDSYPMALEIATLSEAAATKVVAEGRFIIWNRWQLEVPKRVFDPLPGYVLAWAAQERGLLTARLAVVKHKANALFDGVDIK